MNVLFDRVVKVTAYQPAADVEHSDGRYFELAPNALEITDLRVQFAIEKVIGKRANTCTITITNMAARIMSTDIIMCIRRDMYTVPCRI